MDCFYSFSTLRLREVEPPAEIPEVDTRARPLKVAIDTIIRCLLPGKAFVFKERYLSRASCCLMKISFVCHCDCR
jgi:hypothetical protein